MGTKLIPSGSQTVGPFFAIGLDYLIDRTPTAEASAESLVEIRGSVLDRDGSPVADAMLEFWNPGHRPANASATQPENGIPNGFRRAATDAGGNFSVMMTRPAAVLLDDGRVQAPHLLVLVFARGLLRHLISRVYFEHEGGNDADPILLRVPAERRRTLIAKVHKDNSYHWNVILQGAEETLFFAW